MPATARKRKADPTADDDASRKKSPLAGLPQNYYAPTTDMTPEQLQAWRKEQRRERNRQSAAASRQQTKQRIAQLEGEVLKYKTQYEEMKAKMEGMERQIRLLTEFSAAHNKVASVPKSVTPPGSYPNSPSRSPVQEVDFLYLHCPEISSSPSFAELSNSNHLFAECAPDEISSQIKTCGADSFTKEHLIPITGQA